MAIDYSGLTREEIAADRAGMTAQARKVANKEKPVLSSYEQMTGRTLPSGIQSADATQPTVNVSGGDQGGGNQEKKVVDTNTTGDTVTGKTDLEKRRDAFQLLKDEMDAIGLGALVTDAQDILMNAVSIAQMPEALRSTAAYKKRFSANEERIAKGLVPLSPAEYLAKEDAYQNVMRNYGLPETYWTKGLYGKQEGFDKLLQNDVSASELEERIINAQDRVLKSNPEVLKALKQFYPGITNGDILAYSLDPKNALKDIQRKVSAAEIGGAALAQGLNAGVTTAEELAGYGVTKAQAQQGFQNVAEMAPRGSQLAEFYKETPYDQATATAEVFGTAGAVEAGKKRRKLTALEQAQFGGSSGVGALGRDRVAYQSQTYGAGQY